MPPLIVLKSNGRGRNLKNDRHSVLFVVFLKTGDAQENRYFSRCIGPANLLGELKLARSKKLITRGHCIIAAARSHSQLRFFHTDSDLTESAVESIIFWTIGQQIVTPHLLVNAIEPDTHVVSIVNKESSSCIGNIPQRAFTQVTTGLSCPIEAGLTSSGNFIILRVL